MTDTALSRTREPVAATNRFPPQSFAYRADIDGLRAMAVMAVVVCHAELGLPGGYVGVDVFFVISGYLISSLLQKDVRHGTFSLLGFWERRVRRIMPALIAMLTGVLVAGWFVLTPKAYVSLGKSVIGVCCLASNIQFSRNTNYFDPAASSRPLIHTWSLGVEEQFYILWPIVFVLLTSHLRAKMSTCVVAALALSSCAVAVVQTPHDPTATFYLPHFRAWELLVGALLAMGADFRIATPRRRLPRWGIEAASAAGLALIVVPAYFYDENTVFPGLAAGPPIVGAALLIALGSPRFAASFVHRALSSRGMVFIGLCSYSIYLWHWPVLAFAASDRLSVPTPMRQATWAAAGVLLGILSWRYIETPTRMRHVLAGRKALFGSTIVAMISLMSVSALLWRTGGFDERLPYEAQRFEATGQFDTMRFIANHETSDIPAGLTRLGVPDDEPRILVWGDSHAMMYLLGVDQLCREHSMAAVAATHSSTPPVADYMIRSIYGLNDRAPGFADRLLKYVAERKIESVVLAGYWNDYADDPEFIDRLVQTVRSLRASGVAVFFIKDIPIYDFDLAAQLVRDAWCSRDTTRWGITEQQYDDSNPFYRDWIPRLVAEGVSILDPFLQLPRSPLAPDKALPYDRNGSWYRDGHHLSSIGAVGVRTLFNPVLKSQDRRATAN